MSGTVKEAGILVTVRVNGKESTAMLDSGAQPSIIDKFSLGNLGIGFAGCRGQIQGLDDNPVEVCREVVVTIDVGDGQVVGQKLQVLFCAQSFFILGRDFLRKFHCTEFDWDNYRIRLGNKWKDTEANLNGGRTLSRARVAQITSKKDITIQGGWNINPELETSEKKQLQVLLDSFIDVFAVNPKKPKCDHFNYRP